MNGSAEQEKLFNIGTRDYYLTLPDFIMKPLTATPIFNLLWSWNLLAPNVWRFTTYTPISTEDALEENPDTDYCSSDRVLSDFHHYATEEF